MKENTEKLIAAVSQRLVQEGLVWQGDTVAVMGGIPIAGQAKTNFIKLHRIE